MDLKLAIVALEVHFADKSEHLRSAWATVHAKLVEGIFNQEAPCEHLHTHVENLTSGSICDDCGEEV